ncbi:MAG: hypothetical protein ACRDKH_02500 [Solirubrobacterales bacterium]
MIGITALALGVLVGPGTAQAAKVSESEGPVFVPDATLAGPGGPVIVGENSMTFDLKGKKVNKKQILDVEVTLNASGAVAGVLGDLDVFLTKSKIGTAGVPSPGGTTWIDLEFSDQADFVPCNPLNTIASDCNYLQGGSTYTGDLNASLNPVFGGGNPKGNWTLSIQDPFVGTGPGPGPAHGPSQISAELEVKTGAKFAKQ